MSTQDTEHDSPAGYMSESLEIKRLSDIIENYKLRMRDQNEKAQTTISELNLKIDRLTEMLTMKNLQEPQKFVLDCKESETLKLLDELSDSMRATASIIPIPSHEKVVTFNDKLAELEEQILKYYLSKGYKLAKDQTKDDIEWSFKIEQSTTYKNKTIKVWVAFGENMGIVFQETTETTKEMFDKAFEFFKVENT